MNEFGLRLKLLREKKELSYEKLSDETGLAKSLLWRYETGKSEPGLSTLIVLAKYFGVSLDWISGNGDINEVQYRAYADVIDKCVDEKITPERLTKIINAMKE